MARTQVWLALLISLLAGNQAAIDKDEGKLPAGRLASSSSSSSSGSDQHNVINLSLHTGLTSDLDPALSYDLSRTRRLRDALNVFDLSLLAERWGQVEVSAECPATVVGT